MSHACEATPDLWSDVDARYMAAALAIGRREMGRTAPNPSVGALVVKDGIIVGRGWTARGGRPHAEAVALAEAGDDARGATMYVTLEPCSHFGATPPCCQAVATAGIVRLVYAADDPNPVAGGGADYVRARGLSVVSDVCGAAARREHAGHILRMSIGRPLVTLKLAQTPDGFAAGGRYDPRLAITGAATNGVVHGMRAMHDAIMVGVGTIVADDPLLTVRLPGVSAAPLRVVLDSNLRISPRSRCLQTSEAGPILLICTQSAPHERRELLQSIDNVEVLEVASGEDGKQIDLAAALSRLACRGVTRLFSEGGPTVASRLIGQGLADAVVIATGTKPLGLHDGVHALDDGARKTLAEVYAPFDQRIVGDDHLSYYEKVE